MVLPQLNELRNKGANWLGLGQVCLISRSNLTEIVGSKLAMGDITEINMETC